MDTKDISQQLRTLLEFPGLTEKQKEALREVLAAKDPILIAKDAPITTRNTSVGALNLDALTRVGPQAEAIRICLDFGTAMSKAWATGKREGDTLPLLLGKPVGVESLTVPSSVFIASNGRIFLGFEAERQHRVDVRPGRKRFDNLKRMLSEAEPGTELSAFPLRDGIDPTGSGLTGGDLLVLYLAWLTDLAELALNEAILATRGQLSFKSTSLRAVARRFAIPCFESTDAEQGKKRAVWARNTMADALARAQILADTLHGKWNQLTTEQLIPLMNALYKVDVGPLQKLMVADSAIREPIAAGASRFDTILAGDGEPARVPIRQFLLVVDAGAGTTDLAMFEAITPTGKTHPQYALLRKSVRMNHIAGNEIDRILRPILLASCGVDTKKHSQDDVAFAEADLDSQIREIKRRLFESKNITINLKPNFNGSVAIDVLLADSKMIQDGNELTRLRCEIIQQQFSQEQLEALRSTSGGKATDVHVLVTGGSASIPIIKSLSSGTLNIGGTNFRFLPVERLPEWIDNLPRETAQRVADVYPQCAVAIGGSIPKMPREMDDLEIPVTPTLQGKRTLPRSQITGT